MGAPGESSQGLRDFIDALRECLGMAPLYFQNSAETVQERFIPHTRNPVPARPARTHPGCA